LTHYDYGFRIYNPGIARFLSVDPLAPDYPELTTYQFASNTPINSIDLDGLEKEEIIHAFKWAGGKTIKLGKETAFGIYALFTTNPVTTVHNIYNGTTAAANDIGVVYGTTAKIAYATAKGEEIEVNSGFDEAAQRTAKGIVKAGTGELLTLGAIGVVTIAKQGKIVSQATDLTRFDGPGAGPKGFTGSNAKNLITHGTNEVNLLQRGTPNRLNGSNGVYIHYFESGTVYVGKAESFNLGSRSKSSLNELLGLGTGKSRQKATAKKAGDTYKSTTFIDIEGTKFKSATDLEYFILDHFDGAKSPRNYNQQQMKPTRDFPKELKNELKNGG